MHCKYILKMDSERDPPSYEEACSSKFHTKEATLFNEKIFYLNKSASTYAIVGVDPVTFDSTLLICDRYTGIKIPVLSKYIKNFTECMIEALTTTNFTPGIRKMRQYCGVEFSLSDIQVWCLLSTKKSDLLVIHRDAIENFNCLAHIIKKEMRLREKGGYKKALDKLRKKTINRNEHEIQSILYEEYYKSLKKSSKYNIAVDLMRNKEYLLTVSDYKNNFFIRVEKDRV